MPFQKGHAGGPGQPRGPKKIGIFRRILEGSADKLKSLSDDTGWNEGELLDMMIQRAKVSNIKVKKTRPTT